MTRGRLVLAGIVALAVAFVGVGVFAPGRVLQAEFARQRWLAGAVEHRRTVGEERWAYLEAGHGPLVVLVHGFTGSKENWLPLMQRLARTNRVIAPDLPGWGESARRDGADYGPIVQADRLARFVAAFDARPALLVGHSMGGQIVGLAAARHPGLADRYALMSAAGVRFAENEFARAVLAGGNPFQVRTRADLHRYLGIVFTDPPWVPWPLDAALVEQRRADAGFEQRVLDGIARGPQATALQAQLGRIAAPTLLLWCDDDRVIDPSAEGIFARGLPRPQVVLLHGCGHMPMMAEPDLVSSSIASFLGN